MYFWCNVIWKIKIYITLQVIHKENLFLKEYVELEKLLRLVNSKYLDFLDENSF